MTMSEWQPISTAPRDGRVLLAFRFYPVAIRWTGDKEWPWEASNLGGLLPLESNGFTVTDPNLTHWMSLPDGPNADA